MSDVRMELKPLVGKVVDVVLKDGEKLKGYLLKRVGDVFLIVQTEATGQLYVQIDSIKTIQMRGDPVAGYGD